MVEFESWVETLCNFETLNIEWCNDTKRSISAYVLIEYFCFVLILCMQFKTKLDTLCLEKRSC